MVSVTRLSGANRYDTSLELSRSTFDTADTVVVATGEGYADALAASGLAGALEAPLLLTPRDSLYGGIATELGRLGATEVVVLGGEAAVSEGVLDSLAALGTVATRRVAGVDRYATAAAVAFEMESILGTALPTTAFVARGDGFADALAVSPFAYSQAMPVLLTRPGALPTQTAGALTSLGMSDVVVAGGTAAVSAAVASELDALVGTVDRVAGPDRYATAVGIVEYGEVRGWGSVDFVGIATGTGFADALGGGPVCGAGGGLLLLTPRDRLASSTRDLLYARDGAVQEIVVFGGAAAVGDAVFEELQSLIQ
jgi:lactocepin